MVEVDAVKENEGDADHIVPVPWRVMVVEPRFKAPLVKVTDVVIVGVSKKVHPPPTPLNTTVVKVLAAVVIFIPVEVEENVIVPVTEYVMPETSNKLP